VYVFICIHIHTCIYKYINFRYMYICRYGYTFIPCIMMISLPLSSEFNLLIIKSSWLTMPALTLWLLLSNNDSHFNNWIKKVFPKSLSNLSHHKDVLLSISNRIWRRGGNTFILTFSWLVDRSNRRTIVLCSSVDNCL
jgi:hypothetical protein